MNKIYELNQKLDNLEEQKKNFSSLEDTSIIQFIKYKKLLSTEDKLSKKLYKLNLLKKEVNFLYDINTKSWIANPKINCRQYYKFEQKAAYKKDLTLYRLGVLKQKPKSPFYQNISKKMEPISEKFNETFKDLKKYIQKTDFSKFNLFKIIYNKYNIFTSYTLPQKMNNLAINTAKIGIKGYKKLQADCRFIQNSITSKNSFKYLKNVINEANNQISRTEKEANFRKSLKVYNYNYNLALENYTRNSNITPINQKFKRNNLQKNSIEYTL